MRPLPDAAQRVMGIATIRGALVTIYDPRPLLNVAGRCRRCGATVPTRRQDASVWRWDGVYDTVLVDRSEVRPAPGADVSDKLLIGVVRRDRELIAILDAAALLDAAVGGAEAQGGRP